MCTHCISNTVRKPWYKYWNGSTTRVNDFTDPNINTGPVVRIGPHDVAINDQEAAVKIHRRGGGFPKSSFYATAAKIQSMFSTRDRNFHASRRRLLGPCFAEASLVSLQPAVLNLAHTAISNMKNEFKVIGYVDILKWWTLFSMDVIGQLSFGDSFGMVASGKVSKYNWCQ